MVLTRYGINLLITKYNKMVKSDTELNEDIKYTKKRDIELQSDLISLRKRRIEESNNKSVERTLWWAERDNKANRDDLKSMLTDRTIHLIKIQKLKEKIEKEILLWDIKNTST